MLKLIQLLKEMRELGIIKDYAVGGATALIYYFEPFNTQDIDVFVVLAAKEQVLVNLAPIYDFLRNKKVPIKKEYVLIENIPVQFLVPYNDLLEEAVSQGRLVRYGGRRVRIMSLEYMMAIMVQTGRGKDKVRLEELMQNKIEYPKRQFDDLLKKYGLETKWKKMRDSFE
jgi:hypothetical protein